MAREVELASLDLRYESFRLKQAALEERLLASIAQRGIEEPLEGVQVQESNVLLNGFKRYRCARKLRLATVPYSSLGPDEVVGILSLLRTSNSRSLSILEQAAFIDELKQARQLSVAEIAAELTRSKAWVSVRVGLIAEMSGPVRRQLFAGAFPVYSYLYTLRQLMRLNGVRVEQVEEFVAAVSGKGLSVREVEQLAHGEGAGDFTYRTREEVDSWKARCPVQAFRRRLLSDEVATEAPRTLRVMSEANVAAPSTLCFVGAPPFTLMGAMAPVSLAMSHFCPAGQSTVTL